MLIPLLFSATEELVGGPSPRLPELFGMPEPEFVARLRLGDESAYTTLYRTFYPRLVVIATNYVSDAIAEELAQDVLSFVWERRADWKVDDGLGVYLYAAVRNRALKHLRHEGVIGRLERTALAGDETPGMGHTEESSETRLEREDVRTAVNTALSRLADGPRTAFLLRWMHELSYEEIARIMVTTEVTVRQQVARARRVVVPVLERLARG